jgi:hypothetical protein
MDNSDKGGTDDSIDATASDEDKPDEEDDDIEDNEDD